MLLYCLYIFLSPIIFIIILVLSIVNKKIREKLYYGISTQRKAYNHLKIHLGNKSLILFHAASAGEFEQIKPILAKVDRTKFYVLQTFFSPTIYNIEYSNNLFDSCCYHPFDFPWSAILFLKKFKPLKYIITRHDIWPNHIIMAKLLKVSPILINANLYDSSNRLNLFSKGINRFIFNKFDKILTGSDRIYNLLQTLVDKEKIIITGDSRIDQVIERKNKNNLPFSGNWQSEKAIIFASIDKIDISILRSTLPKLNTKSIRIIIAPHEVNKSTLDKIKNILIECEIPYCLYSALDNKSNCVIIDCVGILADLYKYTSIAYVGCGFSSGVHSVIEPAVYNNVVVHGPQIEILDEAIEMEKNNISITVQDSKQLLDALEIIHNLHELNKRKELTKNYIFLKSNSTDKILNELFN